MPAPVACASPSKCTEGGRLNIARTSGGVPEVQTLTSANEETFDPKREAAVRRLVLFEGSVRVLRENESDKTDELWQGEAFDPTRPSAPAVAIYFRIGSAHALVAELVCGCLAHQLNLPAPEVFVLEIPSGSLQQSILVKSDQSAVCVATRDLGGETFHQFLNGNGNAAIHLLRQWPELGKVVAFDEWTANIDRNLDNIIYAATTLHIIDHADAFGGSIIREMVPLTNLTKLPMVNKLSGILNELNANARDAILRNLHTWLGDTVTNIDIDSVVNRARTREWNSDEQDLELIEFLRQRLPLTHSLLCQQLGQPQLPLKVAK